MRQNEASAQQLREEWRESATTEKTYFFPQQVVDYYSLYHRVVIFFSEINYFFQK